MTQTHTHNGTHAIANTHNDTHKWHTQITHSHYGTYKMAHTLLQTLTHNDRHTQSM